MINITLYNSKQDNETVSEVFELKDSQLFIADIHSDSRLIPYNSNPFKVYMVVRNISDMQHFIDICLKYKDVDIIVEETTELYELINQIKDSSFRIALEWIEKSLRNIPKQGESQC